MSNRVPLPSDALVRELRPFRGLQGKQGGRPASLFEGYDLAPDSRVMCNHGCIFGR
jgi:hypothetical protein